MMSNDELLVRLRFFNKIMGIRKITSVKDQKTQDTQKMDINDKYVTNRRSEHRQILRFEGKGIR